MIMNNMSEIVSKLEAKVDYLNKQIYFKDKQIRELNTELNDSKLREQKFIDALSYRLDNDKAVVVKTITKDEVNSESVESFLNPRLDMTETVDEVFTDFNCIDSEFIFIYTEEIFIKHESPDCFLYLDSGSGYYVSLDGLVRIKYPMKPEEIKKLNILKIREASDEEISEIMNKYDL